MSRAILGQLFLVLASRRAFESLVGPIPEAMQPLFRFLKSNQTARIQALLPDCRLVLSKNYRRPASNRWVLEARRQGIPTLLLIDGPLEWSNLYPPKPGSGPGKKRTLSLFEPILHDAVACLGDAQQQWIDHRNAERGISYMNYANHRIQTTTNDVPSDAAPEFDFLLTTAKTPYFGDREARALGAALEACATALERGGYRVLLRIADDALRAAIEPTRAASPSQFGSSPESERISEALTRVRCVIGTPSSVLLEAMQQGKPTAQLMFRDSPLFYQSGWLLGCNEDWKTSFESMLAANPERMESQARTLTENLSHDDFFSHCEEFGPGKRLESPRPFDDLDLAFEVELLRRLLGWRARLLAPILRALSPRSRLNP